MSALLTAAEAAARLREHKRTTLKRLRTGQLRGTNTGRQWLVTEADIQAFLDARSNVRPLETRRRRRA